MKYQNPMILIQWFDHEGNKQWSKMNFVGYVDRRRVYREVTRFIKKNFGKPTKAYVQYIVRQSTKQVFKEQVNRTVTQADVEDWIKRIEFNGDDETDGEAIAGVQDANGEGETSRALPVVSSEPDVRGAEKPLCGS